MYIILFKLNIRWPVVNGSLIVNVIGCKDIQTTLPLCTIVVYDAPTITEQEAWEVLVYHYLHNKPLISISVLGIYELLLSGRVSSTHLIRLFKTYDWL